MSQEPGTASPSLADTLTAVEELLRKFIHFGHPAQSVAITLWVALAHRWDQFETLMYLVITSPVKRTGKTRTFDVLEWLVPAPWRCQRPSEAVTFRRIDRDHPTLLLDEYDTIFGDRSAQYEGLRAIFNSGNRRGTKVSRAVAKGRGFDLVDFDVFCPKALAGIGDPPDTIVDRALVIRMSRRTRGEPVERLRSRIVQALAEPIRGSLAHLMQRLELSGVEPAIPDELGDREADGWEPLLAIADAAGESWPARARQAATALHAAAAGDDDSWGITLLGDARSVFSEGHVDRLWTAPLIDALATIEESPWGDIRGKPLSPTYMAKLLRPFGIRPRPVRVGTEVQRGYMAADFADAWARYLPEVEASGTRYTRYTRYDDDLPAPAHQPAEGPAVTPVTPVTPVPEIAEAGDEGVSRPVEGPDAGDQTTWMA
jgi:hypothetical protein